MLDLPKNTTIIDKNHPCYNYITSDEDNDELGNDEYYYYYKLFSEIDGPIYFTSMIDNYLQEFFFEYIGDSKSYVKEDRYLNGIKRFTVYRYIGCPLNDPKYFSIFNSNSDEPSLIWYKDDGSIKSIEFRIYNVLHNIKGPAIITHDNNTQYCLRGELYSKDEWTNITQNVFSK